MPFADTPKTIELSGYGLMLEAEAVGAITPGMLVERNGVGVRAHGTQGGQASPSFAINMRMTGMGIDDGHEAGQQVVYKTYIPGSSVYAVVAAGAAAIADLALLTSNGTGGLETASAGDVVVAQALEAVDNSGGGTAVRIRAEITMPYVV